MGFVVMHGCAHHLQMEQVYKGVDPKNGLNEFCKYKLHIG